MKIFSLVAGVGLLWTVSVQAAPAKTDSEKQVLAVYAQAVQGDKMMEAGRYAEAAQAFETIYEDLSSLVEDETASFLISVQPKDLKITRLLGLGFSELEVTGNTEIRADRFLDVVERVMRLNQHVVSDDDYATNSQIAGQAIGVVREAGGTVPPDQAPSLAARLRLALAQLQGVVKRAPEVANRSINGSTATRALSEGKALLGKLDQKAAATVAAAASAMPERAKFALDMTLEQLGKMQNAVDADGFLADDDFTDWIEAPSNKLKTIRATMKEAYDQEGKAMPDDATKPLVDQAASLRESALKRAASLTFPSGLVSDPTIEASVRGQLVKNLKGVKVLKVAMKGKEWTIARNDLGVIESRYRYGYVLYQLPGEAFARCSLFSYREQYAGGGSYAKADGASAYSATRWQLGH